MAHTSPPSPAAPLLQRVAIELGIPLERADLPPHPVPLPSRLAVGDLAWASVHAVRSAAGIEAVPDPDRIALSYRSDRHLLIDGDAPEVWSPYSGFWRTADGWVRTHGNYPHHADRLLRGLGLPAGASAALVAEAFTALATTDAVTAVTGVGGLCVPVAREDPAVDDRLRLTPLISVERLDATTQDGAATNRDRTATDQDGTATTQGETATNRDRTAIDQDGTATAHGETATNRDRTTTTQDGTATAQDGTATSRNRTATIPDRPPLSGIRVLDLTRVIAGPVCTRTLALLGADVLRVDPPLLAEPEWQHLDTGHGKRSTRLDARSAEFAALLGAADVVVLGYRPAALARLGLSPRDLADRYPGLVIAQLSAWGDDEPERAGFDSLVQAESGISWIESADGERPGALPAQALDHSAGYLLAAAATAAVRRRRAEGGSWIIRTSLRRIAAELLGMPRRPIPDDERLIDAAPHLATFDVSGHVLTTVGSALPGLEFRAPHPWGSDHPRW